jgi:hypothetical protein
MPKTNRGTKRLTIVAFACAGTLWGCSEVTDIHSPAVTEDVGGARAATTWETNDDAALAAVAGVGAGLAGGLIFDQRSEQSAYRAGYAAGAGRPPPPPAPAAAVLPPLPVPPPLAPAPPPAPLAPMVVPPLPGW